MISETDTIESIRSRWRMKVVTLLIKDNQVLLSVRIGEENPESYSKYFLWKKLKLAKWKFSVFSKQTLKVSNSVKLIYASDPQNSFCTTLYQCMVVSFRSGIWIHKLLLV